MAKKTKKSGGKAKGGKYYILTTRILRAEIESVRKVAAEAGVSVSALIRNRVLGKNSSGVRGIASPKRKAPKRVKRATTKRVKPEAAPVEATQAF